MDIRINNLCKSYGVNKVLHNYTETIIEGKTSFIIGKSGIGKTTLIRILLGLEKTDSGEIIGLDDKKISVVFQDNNLCENLSVLSNLKIVTDNIDENELNKNLKELDLEGILFKKINELSGGMKRRIAILRALLVEFDLLIMDEPFKGLDFSTKKIVIEYIKKCIKGKTVVMVTHDIDDFEYFNDSRIIKIQ